MGQQRTQVVAIQNGVSLDARDKHDRTALYIAAAVQDLASVKCLLDAGAASNHQALHIAVQSGRIDLITLLLEQQDSKMDLSEVDRNGNTPLHIAASRGYNGIVKALLHAGAPTKCLDMDQHTPLEAAIRARHLDTVELLQRADPTPEGNNLGNRTTTFDSSRLNIHDDLGRTPLHRAVLLGHLGTVNQLLEGKADTNLPDQIGRTPLHYAARRIDSAILEALIAAKANVNAVDARNRSPLSLAVEGESITGIQMLLTAGADFSVDHDGRTPLHAAALMGSAQIVQTLVTNHNTEKREELISMSDRGGETAIHLAAERGHDDLIEELLKHSRHLSVIDKKNLDKQTALFVASSNGHLNIVQQLIRSGAIIYRTDEDQNMAIHAAARKGFPEVVNFLLDELPSQVESAIEKWKGLPEWPRDEPYLEQTLLLALNRSGGLEEYTTSTGGTAWRTNVSKWATPEELQKLQKNVLSNLQIFDDGRHSTASTSLMQAVLGGHIEIVKILLDRIPGMPLQAEHYGNANVLSLAASRGLVDIAKLLIAAGAKVNAITDRQETCLHSAAEAGHHEMVQLLLQNNAYPDLACLRGGSTPLHLATKGGHKATVRVLAAVAFVNATDDLGRTPLHVACLDGHDAVVSALMDANADLAAHDFERKTPLELAENLNSKT
ncbi:ankyrin repeat-containing domain protein [Trichoderma austrokoningii]